MTALGGRDHHSPWSTLAAMNDLIQRVKRNPVMLWTLLAQVVVVGFEAVRQGLVDGVTDGWTLLGVGIAAAGGVIARSLVKPV